MIVLFTCVVDLQKKKQKKTRNTHFTSQFISIKQPFWKIVQTKVFTIDWYSEVSTFISEHRKKTKQQQQNKTKKKKERKEKQQKQRPECILEVVLFYSFELQQNE